jgi:hypothetical protein
VLRIATGRRSRPELTGSGVGALVRGHTSLVEAVAARGWSDGRSRGLTPRN